MSVYAERAGSHVQFAAGPRYGEVLHHIPGCRYVAASKTWRAPLSWGTCLAARGVLGAELEVGPDLCAWAEERVRRNHAIEASKDGACGLPGMDDRLREYQRRGATFLALAEQALLADQPGTGKTFQTIAALEWLRAAPLPSYPALIVCPNTLKFTWRDQFAQWAPEVRVSVITGTPTQRRKALDADADVWVVNFEAVKSHSRLAGYGSIRLTDTQREPKELNDGRFRTIVIDEAHRIKDPKAQQTRAIWAVAHDCHYRFALTGTPIANSPEDLFGVMHALAPEEWPSKTKFIERYTNAGLNPWGGLEVFGLNPRTEPELRGFLEPRFLRRTKEEVLAELPPKVYVRRTVEMHPKQAKAYADMAEHCISALDSGLLLASDPLTRLGRLVQIAAALPEVDAEGEVVALTEPSCKVDALLDIIAEDPDGSLVVFAPSRKLIELAEQVLTRKKITCALITGAIDPAVRTANVARFQAGEVQVILATTGAGGEGITLTRASRLVFLQRPWSLVQSQQAEDRIHRIGQEAETVEIIDVVTEGTVEASVHDALTGKAGMLDEITRDPERLRAAILGRQV